MNKLDAYLVVILFLSLGLNFYYFFQHRTTKADVKNLQQNWDVKKAWVQERYQDELSKQSMDELLHSLHNPNFPKPPGEGG